MESRKMTVLVPYVQKNEDLLEPEEVKYLREIVKMRPHLEREFNRMSIGAIRLALCALKHIEELPPRFNHVG